MIQPSQPTPAPQRLHAFAARTLGGSALRGGALLFAATLGVNALNYLYALGLGRALGPDAYGAYAAFMSLFLLLMLVPLTLQQVAAHFRAAGRDVRRPADRLALLLGVAVALALLALSAPLAQVTGLDRGWLAALALALPAAALLGVRRGEAQGEQGFGRLSGNLLLEVLAKIALTVPLLLAVPGAAGGVAATVAAVPLALARFGRRGARAPATGAPVDGAALRRYARPASANLAAQALLVNSDVLLAAALLPSVEAGLYAAVSLFGRVVFYGSSAVAAATFPLASARRAAGRSHRDLLLIALGVVGALSLGAAAGCALAPELVVRLLFGDAFLAAAPLVAPYAFMTALFALANAAASHYLALGSRRAGWLPLVAAALQIVAILAFHATPLAVIQAQMVVKGALLGALLVGAASGWLEKGIPDVV